MALRKQPALFSLLVHQEARYLIARVMRKRASVTLEASSKLEELARDPGAPEINGARVVHHNFASAADGIGSGRLQ
jgi:hypothetical protein